MYKILVVGNGAEPLPEQVRNNKKDIIHILTKMKNLPKNWRSWFTFAITVGTFIVVLYKFMK